MTGQDLIVIYTATRLKYQHGFLGKVRAGKREKADGTDERAQYMTIIDSIKHMIKCIILEPYKNVVLSSKINSRAVHVLSSFSLRNQDTYLRFFAETCFPSLLRENFKMFVWKYPSSLLKKRFVNDFSFRSFRSQLTRVDIQFIQLSSFTVTKRSCPGHAMNCLRV